MPKKHPSAFFGTPLASYLIGLGVDTLVVTGCTTSGCVRGTVVDAFSYNFKCVVPHDAVYDRTPTVHQVNLFDLAQKYADVLSAPTRWWPRSTLRSPDARSGGIHRDRPGRPHPVGQGRGDPARADNRRRPRAGDRLNEVEIAAELAVSRGPLREAMQRLARDGLVRIESHRGAFVRVLDADEVTALFEVRVSLERTAAALAAERAGDDEIAELRGLIASSRGAVEGAAEPHYPERLDLHDLIVRCTRNPALIRYLRLVNQELKLVRARSGFRRCALPRRSTNTSASSTRSRRASHAAREAMAVHLQSALSSTLGLLQELK